MAHRKLANVLAEFQRALQESIQLAADAYTWSLPPAGGGRPVISQKRRYAITELAFLTAFLAWESFLEHSFTLYLLGQTPPGGRVPHRYAFPPDHRTAVEWLKPEGREYAQWTTATQVSGRAERFFRDGRPYAPVLRGNQSILDEARIIRNAIAHKSASARENP